MQTITKLFSLLGISALIAGTPLVANAQVVPTSRIIIDPTVVQDLEINEFNFNQFSEIEITYGLYQPAYGAIAYRTETLPIGIGGPDLAQTWPESYLVKLGEAQVVSQPTYKQGDNFLQLQLLRF
ncbi:hypothetical protein ACE1B6_26645 [Aerosakkonemataceae cyanobacterium BLCC-F154]|uniref:Gingipain propeptide domain-containing protein n=2 Tax=Floridanema TaxID=3396149 RepID=A0ABV4YJB7_9CYAN